VRNQAQRRISGLHGSVAGRLTGLIDPQIKEDIGASAKSRCETAGVRVAFNHSRHAGLDVRCSQRREAAA
jgi:hypothetical protein